MPVFLLGALGFLKRIPWQAWALLGALALVAFLYIRGNHWEAKAKRFEIQVLLDCEAARKAANSPKLACDQTDEQIAFLQEAIGTLNDALDKQNAAVKQLGQETVRQQDEAEKASQAASKRADRAEATAERLAASSRSHGAPSASCPPSKALSEAWR